MNKKAHIGAQNDALFIILGEAPATSNDYPRHDADRTAIARVFDEDKCRRMVLCWNALTDLSQLALEGGWTRAGLEAFGLRMERERNDLLATQPNTTAARDVLAERQRQITAKGWTPEHDDEHVNDEIAALACYYVMPPAARDWDATSTTYGHTLGAAILPEDWTPPAAQSRRRELVKAGALILAEIERMDREAEKGNAA